MKKSLSLAALLSIFSIVSCLAQQTSTGNPRPLTGVNITLSPIQDTSGVTLELYQKPSARSVVRIFDGHHEMILSDCLPAGSAIIRRYLLPDEGEYTFVVETDNEKVTRKIKVQNQIKQFVTINN